MASKRTLYKPVSQESSLPKEKRKALPQGRLITKASAGADLSDTQYSYSTVSDHGIKDTTSVTTSQGLLKEVPRLQLRSKISTTTIPEDVTDEYNVTPRKRLPNSSNEESPRLAGPTHSLDLSDSEADDQPVKSDAAPDVLVIDASRQLKSLDDTEVEIAIHLGHSSAKVVCHTPEKMHSALARTSGSVTEAAKVSVDKIPSICLADGQVETGRPLVAAPPIKQPLVVRESGLPAAAVPHFRALMAMTEHKSPLFDTDQASSDSSRGDSDQHMAPPPMVRNNKPVVSQGPTKTKCVTIDEDISIKIQAKKKAHKVVASRYMQPSKGPVRADRSVVPDGYRSKLNVTNAAPSGEASSRSRQTGGLKRSASDTKIKSTSVNLTPDPRPSYGGQSSTPNVTIASGDGSLLLPATGDISVIGPPPVLDMTAIDRSLWQKPLRSSSYILHEATTGGGSSSNRSGVNRDCVLKNIKSRGGNDVTQWDLELLYGRVIQWAFLESKARKCLREQEKQAMTQLNALFELTEQLRRRKADLELKVTKVRHDNALDEALNLQNTGLKGPVSQLAQLRDQYHHLAEALDTTRHHIPTKGIYIPKDRRDEYIDDLSRALQESERLLGEISVMTRKQAPCVSQCAELLGATETTVERQVIDLSRLQALLSSFNALLTQENILRIQQIYGGS